MPVPAQFPDLCQLRSCVYTEPEAKSHVIVGMLSLVAHNVQSSDLRDLAVEGLVELLTRHPSEQALLCW